MGQIRLFPFPRHAAPAPTVRPAVLVVGVDDACDLARVPSDLVQVDAQLAIRYVAGWEVRATALTPDVWISPPTGSGGRRAIARTLADRSIEQDERGVLLCNGQEIAGGALLSFGSLGSCAEGTLELGQHAGWLVGERTTDAFRFAARTSERLLWVFAEPIALGVPGVFCGWMTAAAHLIPHAAAHGTLTDLYRDRDDPAAQGRSDDDPEEERTRG
jgi:hypothetical protein